MDGKHSNSKFTGITKCFYIGYTAASVFVILAFLCFMITFGVTPYENIQIHTYPFLGTLMAWWILSIQRVIYYNKIGMWEEFAGGKNASEGRKKLFKALGMTYVFILGWTVLTMALFNGPGSDAAFGGISWKDAYSEVTDKIMTVVILIVPMFIYFVFNYRMETVELVINRRDYES